MSIPSGTANRTSGTTTSSGVDKVQQYGTIMNNVLATHFPRLASVPDILYVMMATMAFESGFRILHNSNSFTRNTSNHKEIEDYKGLGRAYWNDPAIVAARNSLTNPQQIKNLREGLCAQALMASMGMYQVRTCAESRNMISGKNLATAEAMQIMVNPGESISAVFPDNEDGATRSIFLGCLVMEQKYNIFAKYNNPSRAIYLASAAYLGKMGTKDTNGTSPEMRLKALFDSPNDPRVTALARAGITRGSANVDYANAKPPTVTQTETRTSTVASTSNSALPVSGCSKA